MLYKINKNSVKIHNLKSISNNKIFRNKWKFQTLLSSAQVGYFQNHISLLFFALLHPRWQAGSRDTVSSLRVDSNRNGQQSRWRSDEHWPTLAAKWRTSSAGPTRRTRPNGPTRIRTSALTNGRWRLNQSGEIWLSRARVRHVTLRDLAIYVPPRDRDPERRGDGGAGYRLSVSSDPVIPRLASLVETFWFADWLAESIC